MKKLLAFIVLIAVAVAVAAAASARAWPTRPVTLLVPFPPGGSTDMLARALVPRLQSRLGQPFVVEHKAGATGTIGAGLVKRAPSDGYTFMVTSLGPLVIAPHLLKGVPYDASKDFDLLTVAVQAPNVLVVPAGSPHQTLADVIAFAKAHPGEMSFGSSGHGSSDHLTAELFWQQTGTTGSHVPYNGGTVALADLVGGRLDASFANVNAVLPHIKAGKLKALAVTGDKRSAVLPHVPTLAQAGVQGVDVYSWQAVVAPKGVPADIRSKMHGALIEALNEPSLRQQFMAVGFEFVGNTPAQSTAFQQREAARWKQLIEQRKITLDYPRR
jgi:tripartite-type tricarboxylate transporter receptor subunit TctC